ncbi:MAG: metallophosphoesterase [Vicinamibacterales bacterium]
MRYLAITDVHANLEALDACLRDAQRHGWERALVLGDIVGYGPDPNGVIDRIRELAPAALVRGNHDKIAFGLHQADGFNQSARIAAEWTLNELTADRREWLVHLPPGPLVVDDGIQICHGSPVDEDEYVFDELDARRAIDAAVRPLCLYGHTHVALAFSLAGRSLGSIVRPSAPLLLKPDVRYMVNPGSVGQPRDGDARAAYAIVDTVAAAVEFYRVEYSIPVTQAKMGNAGLPEALIRRLPAGR